MITSYIYVSEGVHLPEDFCFPCKSAIAVLIASSAKTLQCILTGGKASSSSGVAAVALDMAKKKNVEKINRKLQ